MGTETVLRVEKERLGLEVGRNGSRQEADDLHRVGAAVQCLCFYQLCKIGFSSYGFSPLRLQRQSGLGQGESHFLQQFLLCVSLMDKLMKIRDWR